MKALVVYNPAAGGGREALLGRFVRALENRGVDVEVYRTRAPGDATEQLRARAHLGDVVVAVGGDGTTNEVLNGLRPGVPLAVFGTGTANVLARELGLPRNPERAAEVVAAGHELEIWAGRLNGQRFLMWVGIGYDAWVVNNADLRLKETIGQGAYMVAMLSQIARYGSQRFQLVVDGRAVDCYSAIVANARYYGGSFILSQHANIARPSLQVLMFRKAGRWNLIKFMLALLVGRMESMDGVESVAARHLQVKEIPGEPLQADGDPAGWLPADIQVDSEPVSVLVPEQTLRRFS